MTFKEKIDKLLSVSKKKFNSLYDLETKSGLGMGTLRKAYEENREPSNRIIGKFLETLRINTEWWETGNGEIYLGKGTDDDKLDNNKEKEEVYRALVEGNTEYILIPRSVLQEKYRLVSVEKLEEDRENWKKDKAVIDRLLNMYEELASEMKDRLKTQSPVIKEAQ